VRAGRPTGAACAAIASLLVLLACSGTPPVGSTSGIVIGVDVSRDTSDPAAADSVTAAVRALVETRYHGRLEGIPVTVRVLDDSAQGRPDPARAAANMRALVADPLVLGVVGPIQSNLAVAQIPIASAAHLVLVSPANTNACLTHPGTDCEDLATRLRGGRPVSYFRVLTTDDGLGEAAAAFAAGIGPVAVGSDASPYGRAVAESFATALRKQGGVVAVRAGLDPRSKPDLDKFLEAAASAGARAVFFGGRDSGGACLVRASMPATLPPTTPFLGGDAILSPTCLKDAGSDLAGLFAVSTGPDSEASVGLAAADAAGALLEAIAQTIKANGGNLPSREEVRSRMARTTAYPGHWGRFGFDANGDTTLRIYTVWTASGTPPAWTRLKSIQLPGAWTPAR